MEDATVVMGDNGPMVYRISLADSGAGFDADADHTLLDAAERAGHARPWRCPSGTCGSCRAHLRQGRCISTDGRPLEANRRGGGRPVLPCQVKPRSDLELARAATDPVAPPVRSTVELMLDARTVLSPDVVRLHLRPPPGQPLFWLPGQYLELRLPGDKRRAFSIANRPGDHNRIELHVRRAVHSESARWLFDEFQPGMRVHADGPLGTFVPRENSERPMLFVAGGTGIAPIKAIIEHFADLGSRRPMQLYWGARRLADLYLETWLENRSRRLPRLSYTPVVSAPRRPLPDGMRRGLVVDVLLADHPSLAAFDVYLCGPPGMVQAAQLKFADTDLPPAQIIHDSFQYDPELLADILSQRAGIRTPQG